MKDLFTFELCKIEEVEYMRNTYEEKMHCNIIGSSQYFHNWYNAAKAFFKVNINNEDEDYQAFSKAQPSGNEYILKHIYDEIIGNYYALLSLYNNTKNASNNKMENIDKKKIFIVHGHDELLLEKVKNLIIMLGLNPIILNQKANKGASLLGKLERYTDVGYAIVLYTPCDLGMEKTETDYKARARQNVVFEHGYLIAKLGRENVAVLKQGDVEMPSDISGIAYVDGGEWRYQLVDEMKAAGLDVNKNDIR